MNLNEMKTLLRETGVVGAGGAGFPSYAKLTDQADIFILNCAECEPLLKVHRQVLEAHTTEVLNAMSEIVRQSGAKQGIIAIKEHYRSALQALEAEIGDHPGLSIHKLASVYPAGDELILIKEVTGRVVQPGKLPMSVGVVVCNVESVYNIHRAMDGYNVTDKYVTVAGEVKSPKTLLVPLGTRISELIEAAGGLTCQEVEYISGGPMMGKKITPFDVVTKTTNAIIVLPQNHTVILNKYRNAQISLRRAMSVCCQCGSCTELCSRHVMGYPVEPHLVMRVLSNGGRGDEEIIQGSLYCSGCGLCETFSCPQDLSPRVMIDAMKALAREQGRKPPQDLKADPNVQDADLKKVSVERLTMRLGLKKYDVLAPLHEEFETKSVRILLSQHLGAPAEPVVSVGDRVKKGDLIAKAKEGALSVNIHASIDGTVKSVQSKYIQIQR